MFPTTATRRQLDAWYGVDLLDMCAFADVFRGTIARDQRVPSVVGQSHYGWKARGCPLILVGSEWRN